MRQIKSIFLRRVIYCLLPGLAIATGGFFFVQTAHAYETQVIPDTPEVGDFVLGPGKTEYSLDPGESVTQRLYVTNRLGRTADFEIEIEDFAGSDIPDETVVLLGTERGPFPLKDYINPELLRFTLNHGERMILPVTISLPENADPGGHYGAVLIKTTLAGQTKVEREPEKVKPSVSLVSRLGSLFFVRVKGAVNEDGFFKEFKIVSPQKILGLFYEKGPVTFQLLFKNNGSVHLTPYGTVEITNMLGKKVAELQADPFYALPNSTRERKVEWKRNLLIGRYKATATLNRSYENITDQKTIVFWVIPWKLVLLFLLTLTILIWLMRWIFRHIDVRIMRR